MEPSDVSTLRVPAGPTWLEVVRLFVCSVGEASGLPPEGIDELRLVLTEICADAPGLPDGTIALELRSSDGRLGVTCEGVLPPSRDDDPSDPHVLRTRVLDALVPDATWVRTEERPATVLFEVAKH